MKDKAWALGVLLVTVLLVTLATSRETDAQQGRVGRYQIAAGDSDGSSTWAIDTVTGQLWSCWVGGGQVTRCFPVVTLGDD